jgi:hypothetical protein
VEQLLVVLPIVAFLILATLFGLFLRRAGRLMAATRDVERFRRQASDLVSRAETSLGEICNRIDAVRRGQLSAVAVGDDLTASIDAVDRYVAEARELHPPIDGTRIRDDIAGELERAKRALEMVEHGVAIQASARAGSRELEAQTAIKRGYLNVLHAREAIARHSASAAAMVAMDPARRAGAARRTI